MARFKIVTTGPGGSDHSLEMETLRGIGAEIVEVAGGDDELAKAVMAPAVTDKLSAQGMEVRGAPPEQLDAFVRKEIPRWAKVIKDNNIKLGD